MSEQIDSSPSEETAHVVYLNPISISNERFEQLFYFRTDGKFRISTTECDATEYLLSEQVANDMSFNLLSTIVGFYEEDLGLAASKWESCSFINLQKQLLKMNSLCKYCNTTCSLTRGEIVKALEGEGGIVDGTVIHRLRLNLLFTNAHPDIRDVKIVVQYDVALTQAPLESDNARFC